MRTNKVLFVDDEVNILNAIKRSVVYEDYIAMFALNGEKAIDIIQNNNISVIVTDMKMQNMNGFDLLKKVKEISPDTIRIVLSGYNQLTQILATVNSVGVFKYITKPWNDELEFLPAIREGVNYYNLKLENDMMKKELEEKNAKYKNLLKIKDGLIKSIEMDIFNIKTINNAILQIQDVLFSKLKSNINYIDISEYYLKLINSIYSDFLTTFPTALEKFNIKRLKENFAAQTNNKIMVDVDNLDFNHEGNYRLILLVLTELVNYINKKQSIDDISVQFRSYPSLTIKICSGHENLYEFYNSNVGFKLIISFLREILKTSGGDLIIEENNNKQILILANTKI